VIAGRFPILGRFAWPSRVAAYALVGILTFVTQPPGATAVRAQLAGYLLAGAGLLTWGSLDLLPVLRPTGPWVRYRPRVLLAILFVIAVGAGFAAGAGQGENNCAIIITGLAATSAGYTYQPLTAWAVTGAGLLAFEANLLVYPDGLGDLSTFLLQPLGPIAALLFGLMLRGRRVQAEQSAALLAQTRELQEQERQVDVLGERARIAREIHDILAHSLGALGIQIQAARAVLTDQRDIDRAVDVLVTAQRMAAEGLTETRRAVHALRTDHRPLNTEIGQATADHGERYHVGVSFAVGGVPRPLPPDATVALLRIAQEALVNAAKHAAGQDVAVRLDFDDRDVRLIVANDVDQARSVPKETATGYGGYGLTGMRERLRLLGGTLEAGPRGSQWVVAAGLPRAPVAVS
jgi:signal transduction histidine kinase